MTTVHRHSLGSLSSSSSLLRSSHSNSGNVQDEHEPFSNEMCRSKLRKVSRSTDQIKGTAAWIFHHRSHLADMCRLWLDELKKAPPTRRLTQYYVAHETLAMCKKRRFEKGFACFQSVLREATVYCRDKQCKPGVRKVFKIFEEASFFPEDFLRHLKDDLNKGRSTSNHNKVVLLDFDPAVIGKIAEQMDEYQEQALKKAEKEFRDVKADAEIGDAVIAKIKEHTVGKEQLERYDIACARMREYEAACTQDLAHEYDLLNQLELLRVFYSTTTKEADKVILAYGNYETVAKNGMKHLEKQYDLLHIPLPGAGVVASGPSDEESGVVDMELSDDEEGNKKKPTMEGKGSQSSPTPEPMEDDEPYTPPGTSPRTAPAVPQPEPIFDKSPSPIKPVSRTTIDISNPDSFAALLSSLPLAPLQAASVPPAAVAEAPPLLLPPLPSFATSIPASNSNSSQNTFQNSDPNFSGMPQPPFQFTPTSMAGPAGGFFPGFPPMGQNHPGYPGQMPNRPHFDQRNPGDFPGRFLIDPSNSANQHSPGNFMGRLPFDSSNSGSRLNPGNLPGRPQFDPNSSPLRNFSPNNPIGSQNFMDRPRQPGLGGGAMTFPGPYVNGRAEGDTLYLSPNIRPPFGRQDSQGAPQPAPGGSLLPDPSGGNNEFPFNRPHGDGLDQYHPGGSPMVRPGRFPEPNGTPQRLQRPLFDSPSDRQPRPLMYSPGDPRFSPAQDPRFRQPLLPEPSSPTGNYRPDQNFRPRMPQNSPPFRQDGFRPRFDMHANSFPPGNHPRPPFFGNHLDERASLFGPSSPLDKDRLRPQEPYSPQFQGIHPEERSQSFSTNPLLEGVLPLSRPSNSSPGFSTPGLSDSRNDSRGSSGSERPATAPRLDEKGSGKKEMGFGGLSISSIATVGGVSKPVNRDLRFDYDVFGQEEEEFDESMLGGWEDENGRMGAGVNLISVNTVIPVTVDTSITQPTPRNTVPVPAPGQPESLTDRLLRLAHGAQ